jgi:prepilin-type N-terminal cleavage/methylation domain-containing protein
MRRMVKQRGLSLIELMVSLLLGALLLAGLVAIFQQGKMSSIQDEAIARMQENGRFALRHLGRELSMLGFWGGLLRLEEDPAFLKKSDATAGDDCATDWMLDLEVSAEFENDATASPYPDCISDADVLDGTDVVAIRRVADRPARWFDETGALDEDSTTLTAGGLYFKTNQVEGEMYSAADGTDDQSDGLVGDALSKIFQYLPQVLYVRPWAVTAGDGIPTLVREVLRGNDMQAEPLVEGIESIQVEWGIDGADADLVPDYYDDEPGVADLSAAVTARIYVLVRSLEPVTGYLNDKTYRLGSKTIAATNDAYYRRVYATTVQLRNAEKFKMQAID